MDRIDRRILQELEREGRLSNAELADRVGLSPSACSRRVTELEHMGAIRGYRAVLDLVAYKHFHTKVLGALPQVATITSYIVMESAKDERV